MGFEDNLYERRFSEFGFQTINQPGQPLPLPSVAEAPPEGSVLGAAFRQDNIIGSLLARKFTDTNEPEPGFNAWESIRGTKYERHWQSFVEVNNSRRALALRAQIDMEEEDRKTLDAAGWMGTFAQMGAGVLDPTVLLPGGGAVRTAKGGFDVVRSALLGGAAIGAGVAAQEGILQATQETRPLVESAIAVGGGAVLGAVLGGGIAARMSSREREAATNALAKMYPDETGVPPIYREAQAAGAAPVDKLGVEDLTIAGGAARTVAQAMQWLNPNLRANFRASPTAREVTQSAAQNTLYQGAHERGVSITPGGAAETLADVAYRSRMAQAVTEHDQLFSEMRKAGTNVSRVDFEQQIGYALRNGDQAVDGNEHVTRAAQTWRARVFEPFKKEAIELGLLPADVTTETAASYFSRMYNRDLIIAQEARWKETIVPHLERQIQEDFAKNSEALRGRVSQLEQEAADLRVPAEQRVQLMNEIEARGAALDAANVDQIDRLGRITELQERVRSAAKRGDRDAARAAREEIAGLKAEGGEELVAYRRERASLRRRRDTLNFNYAGLTERSERIAQQLVDLEEQNVRSIERLIERGRKFERDAARLDPAKFDAEKTRLVEAFNDAARRADKSAEATKKAIETLRARQAAEGEKASTVRTPQQILEEQTDRAVANRLEKDAALQAKRAEQMTRIAQRLERLDNFDPVATLAEIKGAVDRAVQQVSAAALAKGERGQRLLDRLKSLDPKKIDDRVAQIAEQRKALERGFYDRWEVKTLGEGVDLASGGARFTDAARQIADDVTDKILGRNYGDGSALPQYATPITKGPMKDRTFNIPDKIIEEFLVSNVREVAERYARTMAAETALTRRFGKADMRDQIQAIRQDYARLRAEVEAAATPAEAMAVVGKTPGAMESLREFAGARPAKERILAWLDDDMKGAVNDVAAVRDLLRGTYKAQENSSNFAKVSRALRTFNYLRLMGGVLIANLTEVFRPAMVHGLGTYMSEGIAPLMKNMAAVKMSVAEAQQAGLVVERILQHRMMSMAEIGDPYQRNTGFERFMRNASTTATRWNGIALITDMNEAVGSVLSQNRILRGALGQGDRRFLAYLDIDDNLAERIGQQFKAHGEVLDGVHVANTERWTDENAVRAYRAAVTKDVNSIVVRSSVGDKPLFANTPIGQLLLQFRGYNIAANTRVMLRGMQEDKSNFVAGMAAMTAVGALASYLQAVRGGADRLEKWKRSAENPGFLIGEGLDRSGIFPLMFEAADTVDKFARLTGNPFNPVKTPLTAAFPGDSQQGDATRFAQRDFLAAAAGPSAGLPTQLARALGAGFGLAAGEDPKKAQVNAAVGLIPFGSYVGAREAIQMFTGDSPYMR